ncbi:MAG: aspartate carbamoyltransferase regulatory subunit [Bacteroidales bacterium]|jgi:aspartate carbamoyltransferase regulatory subunit|nr:aspartate carbamoyltransferase regulatory subunit [Bacteroidales bacterium]MBR5717064.1 aspartate carbamoyltransferase regulatory subunit [Bacteroidales bacterium]
MSDKKELEVSAIKNGTVIDHIPANVTFKIVQILDLYNHPGAITIGTNLDSISLGKKGIIKIADRYLTDEEIGRLSVVSPDVTLNIIKDYQIVEKKYVKYPKQIIGVVKCTNPKCVTNHQPIPTKMEVFDMNSKSLRCIYCERVMQYGEIELL